MTPPTDMTVIVVTWQGVHLIGPCLESLSLQDHPHRLVVVDNASTDGTTDFVAAQYPAARVLSLSRNLGFAGGVAAALGSVQTRYVALLNNDAEADPHWLAHAAAYLDSHPDLAAATSRMLLTSEPGTMNNAGIVLLPTGYGADRGLGEPDGPEFDEPVDVFGASGGAAVYRTLALKGVGGFEARYFMYYEDLDVSWRLRLAGWRIGYCPRAIVRHQHAASSQPGSPSFAFHTERNRLLTLARCAPLPYALAQSTRYLLTTASISVQRACGRTMPDSAVFNPGVRLKAIVSAAQMSPKLLRVRRSATREQRRRVFDEWLGVPERSRSDDESLSPR